MKEKKIMKRKKIVRKVITMVTSVLHEKRLKGEHILIGSSIRDCIFCDMLKEYGRDETFITRLEFGSLFLHKNQNYLGRCLYVSNVHVDTFPHIDYELFSNLNREMLLVCKEIEKIFQPDVINFASLGNVVRHFHFHIIPRYRHDSNWGSPPWPSGEKKLTKKDFEGLILTIRMSLEVE